MTTEKNIITLFESCQAQGLMIATAESCTAGLISATLTDVAGSSCVFERGFVTYSNEAKTEMLAVEKALIQTYGAVSEEVARAMAEGALRHSHAQLSVAVTGIAGPGGGSAEKPVGLVHFACACAGKTTHAEQHVFSGDRAQVRAQTVAHAIGMLQQMLQQN